MPKGVPKLLAQHFARVNRAHAVDDIWHGHSLSVVIDNFDMEGIATIPYKAQASQVHGVKMYAYIHAHPEACRDLSGRRARPDHGRAGFSVPGLLKLNQLPP